MINKELYDLERWQASPEGDCYLAVRDLDFALDKLTALSQSREGVKFIRREIPNINSFMSRMHDLIVDFQPVLEAAE